jgi:hypothetical protein
MTILAATSISLKIKVAPRIRIQVLYQNKSAADRARVLVPSSTLKVCDGTSNLSNPMAAVCASTALLKETRIIRGTAGAHVSSRGHRRMLGI